jgi:hypothetical protein
VAARQGRRGALICAGTACLLAALSCTEAASAESRSFVVAWFTAAAYAQDDDCPDGLNPSIDGIYRNALNNLGVSPEEVERLYKNYKGTTGGEEAAQIIVNRGRVDGKPVNAYANPTAVPDPHLHTVQGRYAFGFNLDGKGAASRNGFEDPETHERGVNNEYWRAMGCNKSFRAVPPQRPVQGGEYQWDTIRSTTPAWLITVSGDDLDKDGEVTVMFERALEHVSLDARSETAADMTYRVDPDPRWHNQFRGRVEHGLITATMPADFRLESDPYFVQEFVFHQPHLRLRIKPDGNLEGIVGGYQPWLPIYYSYGGTSIALECCAALDFVGVYYTLRRLADGYPDPQTGRNTAISTAYRIDAVPAFVVPAGQPASGARLSTAH